jgi:membrane-associated phospholipid phosphatase
MSIDAKRRMASAAFLALLALSVFWPAPVIAVNDICCHAALRVDNLSFLGREAPSWDVAFWCLTGLLLLAIVQSAPFTWRELWRETLEQIRATRARVGAAQIAVVVTAALLTAAIWRWADQPVTALAERLQTRAWEEPVRLANRFGGGMNPAMIVLFYLIAGGAYRQRRWIGYAVSMAFAGAGAGILVQLVKFAVGRTRPELWLGAFHRIHASASSFPSGHTVGAFALAGVLALAARSTGLRVTAILLALAVAVSRVLAFRHWTSDVFASMCIGMVAAWLFVSPVTNETEDAP